VVGAEAAELTGVAKRRHGHHGKRRASRAGLLNTHRSCMSLKFYGIVATMAARFLAPPLRGEVGVRGFSRILRWCERVVRPLTRIALAFSIQYRRIAHWIIIRRHDG
jgi:hypothetical protein